MKRGFQLIEVIVAGSIFFLIALFVLNLLPSAQLASRKADARLTGETLAHSVLEELRGNSFRSLVNSTHPDYELKRNRVVYTVKTTVTTITGTNPDLIREVRVEVVWSDTAGEHNAVASSYVSKVRR